MGSDLTENENREDERVSCTGHASIYNEVDGEISLSATVVDISRKGLKITTDCSVSNDQMVKVRLYIKERHGDKVHELDIIAKVIYFNVSSTPAHGRFHLGLEIKDCVGSREHYDECLEDLLELKNAHEENPGTSRIQ